MKLQLYGFVISTFPELQASTDEQKLKAFKMIRDVLLRESDWTQVADCPLSDNQKEEWKSWRQSLRNFTKSFSASIPNCVVIEEPPTETSNKTWANFDPDNNEYYKQFLIETGFIS